MFPCRSRFVDFMVAKPRVSYMETFEKHIGGNFREAVEAGRRIFPIGLHCCLMRILSCGLVEGSG